MDGALEEGSTPRSILGDAELHGIPEEPNGVGKTKPVLAAPALELAAGASDSAPIVAQEGLQQGRMPTGEGGLKGELLGVSGTSFEKVENIAPGGIAKEEAAQNRTEAALGVGSPHLRKRKSGFVSSGMSDFEANASSAGMDEDMSREQLLMIKARTMYQMTEEVGVGAGRKRLLFLTNPQADLISSSNTSMQKMLDALEIPKPKLVINLLTSQGFSQYVNDVLCSENVHWTIDYDLDDMGLVPGRGPFLQKEDEENAIDRLDHFMGTVILPLAAQTQAIILCNAVPARCVLSASLTRMLSVHRASWGKDIPFTVLSISGNVGSLYHNPDETAAWRGIRRASKAWRQSDRKLLELVWASFDNNVPTKYCDLDPNAMVYLLVDSINEKKHNFDRAPFNNLVNELVRYLSATLPSLTIKTGNSDKPMLEESRNVMSSLGVALEVVARTHALSHSRTLARIY